MKDLMSKIKAQSEMCKTTEDDEFECISIEKLNKIFKKEKVVVSEKLADQIESETEYLDNEEDEEIECISVENVEGILKRSKII